MSIEERDGVIDYVMPFTQELPRTFSAQVAREKGLGVAIIAPDIALAIEAAQSGKEPNSIFRDGYFLPFFSFDSLEERYGWWLLDEILDIFDTAASLGAIYLYASPSQNGYWIGLHPDAVARMKARQNVAAEVASRQSANEYRKKSISAATRRKVFERDGFVCLHCGSQERLWVDHIHPESLGGAHKIDNFQTLCRSCNSKKGATQ